ncbi:MAG TPA: alpha/beta hydrolase [Planctomycetota bacterium]|nr:alpha/beta hydrolase [Planctomycetota bacterium]
MNNVFRFLLVLVLLALAACSATPRRDPLELRDGTTKSADGVAIHYVEGGSGKTTLVFVHGWTGDTSVWKDALKRFAPRARVVALDLAGHGRSGHERTDWTVEHFADDVCAVVHALDLRDVVLVGHSMSGPITVAAANRLKERVVALVPVDTLLDAEWKLPPEIAGPFFGGLRADFPTNVEQFFRSYLTVPGSPKDVVDSIFAQARAADPKIAVPMLERAADFDLQGGLRELRIPIHAINSDMNATQLEKNRKYAPRFEAEIVKGIGHWPHLEAPERFADALEHVLAALGR